MVRAQATRSRQYATDLGGDHIVVWIFVMKEAAQTIFAQAKPVERRRVVKPYTRIPSSLQNQIRLFVADRRKNIADLRPAHAKSLRCHVSHCMGGRIEGQVCAHEPPLRRHHASALCQRRGRRGCSRRTCDTQCWQQSGCNSTRRRIGKKISSVHPTFLSRLRFHGLIEAGIRTRS
ncbi:hypothetical protein D3C76_1180140 [compost metagenome]